MSVDTTNTATEPAPQPAAILYTEQRVADALNHAADDISTRSTPATTGCATA
jgi:hypothetical protein